MERSGRNRSQPVANGSQPKTAQTSENHCRGLLPVARRAHGKEGVDGSSPSEGFGKVPANWHFVVVCPLNTRTHSGHIFGTGDAPRRLATPHGTLSQTRSRPHVRRIPCLEASRLPE